MSQITIVDSRGKTTVLTTPGARFGLSNAAPVALAAVGDAGDDASASRGDHVHPWTGLATDAELAAAVAVETVRAEGAEAGLIPLSQKGAHNGVATLDSSGLVPQAQIPAVALSTYLGDTASDAAMTALVAQPGDWTVRTDFEPDRAYMLNGSDPTQVGNWKRMTFGDVVSVNARTGAVTGLAEQSALDAETARATAVEATKVPSGALESTQGLLQKLHEGIYNANWVVASDSTAAHPFCWPYRTAQAIAALFPAVTALYKQWSQTGGSSFDPTLTAVLQSGTGGKLVTDGGTTNASPTLTSTSQAQFSSLNVGDSVLHANVPAGTTIVSVESATSATMSANATAGGSGLSVRLTKTFTLWNVSIPGKNTWYWQAPYLTAQFKTPNPDLIFVATGHNEGAIDPTNNPAIEFRARLAGLGGLIRRVVPGVPVVLLAQNPALYSKGPTVINYDQVLRRDEIRALCASHGYGFVDACQAFLDQADIGPLLIDLVHPTGGAANGDATDGQALIVAEVMKAFVRLPGVLPRSEQVSCWDEAAPVNLAGPILMVSTDASPPGWTLANCTATYDTVTVPPLSNLGYSIRLSPVDIGQFSRIYKQILTSAQIAPWKDTDLTVIAWCWRTAAERYAAQMALSDGVGGASTLTDDHSVGAWEPRILPHHIDAASTGITVSLYCHGAAAGETSDVFWSPQLLIIPGVLPKGRTQWDLTRFLPSAQFAGMIVGDALQVGATEELRGTAGSQRERVVSSGVLRRWSERYFNAETGGDVGTDKLELGYHDDGTFIGTWMTTRRRDGRRTFGGTIVPLSGTTAARPSASTQGAGALYYNSDLGRMQQVDVTGTTWLTLPATLYVSGAGKVIGTDADFPSAPPDGTGYAIRDSTTGISRWTWRSNGAWVAVEGT